MFKKKQWLLVVFWFDHLSTNRKIKKIMSLVDIKKKRFTYMKEFRQNKEEKNG